MSLNPADLIAMVENDAPEHHPSVDRRAEEAVVIEMERPVVPLTSWIADAIAVFGAERKAIQVMTPPTSRLTHPLWALLSGPGARWVVEDAERGYFDGVNGLPLEWDEKKGFRPVPQVAGSVAPVAGFQASPQSLAASATHVLVDLTVEHPASEDLVLGGAAETLASALTGDRPVGWSTNEPAVKAWDRRTVTDLCRKRAPKPSRLFVVGPHGAERPFIGPLTVKRTGAGLLETLSLAVAIPPGHAVPHDDLMHAVELLAAERLIRTMVVNTLPGRADLTYEPRWLGAPVPFGMAIGHSPVEEMGLEHAMSAPVPGIKLGPEDRTAVWYPLNETDPKRAFSSLQDLTFHLMQSTNRNIQNTPHT
ncbi:DUF6177 family protein [Nocardiopsis sp. RSe5-2]|uniref:DUF6177 family protein n=1 Tax=Nocardiopsis endophytica TaxID=3018445 RepID=A0ABT4TYC6_9ACTN|nr:DUF6177 family protein [Nocardiopsis endophytica]MDA2809703.1 DUF6177 family protein [Nocardiopsis endophytica]